MNFDRARLRYFRVERAWTQEQLADRSGVSTCTVQRLERRSPPSAGTWHALAVALGIAPAQLSHGKPEVAADSPVRRVTPLVVLNDIRAMSEQYQLAGFVMVQTEDTECVGLRATTTGLILATARFMHADYHETTVARMLGRATPYLYVRRAEETRKYFSARPIEQVATRAGILELVMENEGGLFILAEKHPS